MTQTNEKLHIIAHSDAGIRLAKALEQDLFRHKERLISISSTQGGEGVNKIASTQELIEEKFQDQDAWIFIGALGICVRHIAPLLQGKTSDPPVINIDEQGAFVQPVISGHRGGANEWARKLARITGGQAVITTASDGQGLWGLDLLGQRFGWSSEFHGGDEGLEKAPIMNRFNQGHSTALLLEVQNEGTRALEKEAPEFVTVYRDFQDIPEEEHELLLAVTPFEHESSLPSVQYRPACFHLGIGCEKNVDAEALKGDLSRTLQEKGISRDAIAALHTIELKKEEEALQALSESWNVPLKVHSAERLNQATIPNPSEEVYETIGAYGVAEPAALVGSGSRELYAEKEKRSIERKNEEQGQRYTFALAGDGQLRQEGEILIVGAGTGDPDLITVKGLQALADADLILYAGSLIPEELLKATPTKGQLRNSASMDLEEQFELIDAAYAERQKIVRLHSGDPSIYGAIHEQIKHFEDQGYRYEIIPGIAANQAAAALLKTEFTLPGKVQSIVLTRTAGRTAMPNKEELQRFAETGSTLCIFLSAKLIKRVKAQLLEQLPADTPAAVCYRLTWPDEMIVRGRVDELDDMVRKNKLTRTVLLVVGEALTLTDERSSLYNPSYPHIFRKKRKEVQEDGGNGD